MEVSGHCNDMAQSMLYTLDIYTLTNIILKKKEQRSINKQLYLANSYYYTAPPHS